MENKKEKVLDYIFIQLTEIYYLKGICLEVLRELENKSGLTEKEKYWKFELYNILFHSVDD